MITINVFYVIVTECGLIQSGLWSGSTSVAPTARSGTTTPTCDTWRTGASCGPRPPSHHSHSC